jgi:acyl-CoA thioester hydrolase
MTANKPFAVQAAVHRYELDSNDHANRALYVQYAEHARWECFRAAGVRQADLAEARLGPVTLEESIRSHRELHLDDKGGHLVRVGHGPPSASQEP